MRRAQRSAATAQGGISKSLGLIKSGIAGFASGLSVGLVAGVIERGLQYAGSLGEIAEQLSVTTKELQEFRFAAQQNGSSLEEADKSLGKFTLSISKALSGSKQTAAAFGAVGVSLDDLRSKSKSEIIGQIADEMVRTGGAGANAAAGVAIFGKGFQKLIPLLNQGSKGMGELGQAAQELGVVLSDDLINQADVAADKVDALKTVLSAQIAGSVAANANAILELANSLLYLSQKANQAYEAMVNFQRNYNIGALASGAAYGLNRKGSSVTAPVGFGGPDSLSGKVAKRLGLKLAGSGGDGAGTPNQFLGGGGGAPRKARSSGSGRDLAAEAERQRQEALRDAYQFASDQRRANMDILRSQRDLAGDYIERAKIGYDILEAERAAYVAELDFAVASKDKTKAQADQLLALYDINHALEKQKLATDLETQRVEDVDRLDGLNLSLKREQLERQAGLAETQSERRQLELEILRLAYEEKRQALQRIIDRSKDAAEIEGARRELSALPDAYSADQANVRAGTRGPMEDYLASLPTTAAKAQEALEHLQVQGIEGLLDSALKLSEGLGAAKDSLLDTLKQFFLGMARMELQKGLGSLFGNGGLIASLPKGIPGFHSGGGGILGGLAGLDRNLLSLNGMPIARVSRGEMLNVMPQNDNSGGVRQVVQHWNINTPDADSFRRSGRQIMREQKRGLALS